METRTNLTIRLNPADNVVVARADLNAGVFLTEERITCRQAIPFGHKVATLALRAGDIVRKYGQVIGVATRDIVPGDHVHTQNLRMSECARDYAVGVDALHARAAPFKAEFFDGILRADGRVATRNYIGVISTVNCSASVARMVADRFRGPGLDEFPNVDGVVPLCYGYGCAMADCGRGYEYLRDALLGYGHHPNFAAVLFIGLGCETMRVDMLRTADTRSVDSTLHYLTIQEKGGTRRTIEAAVAQIREMLPSANAFERQALPAGRLVLGLECGGSDALSGVTANPALGAAADLLVDQGGTAILAETPEIYGAEHLLTRRATRSQVADKLIDCIRWWEEYTAREGGHMDNNPTPGNKAGGLTTILEKSLGAVAKGGTRPLMDVYRYAELVRTKGLVFMDTPGYDAVSVTGLVAGGANIICFTTGRGAVFGCRPVPSIKLASNTPMFMRMEEDMDINCGVIADGEVSVQVVGAQIFRRILQVASGSRTKSESLGMGNDEFVPWHVGAVM